MIERQHGERWAAWLCVVIAAAMFACIMLSLGGGLDTEDEATDLFMLTHPSVPSQFIDHQLWGPIGRLLGGSFLTYRLMPLAATALAGLVLASSVAGWLRREESNTAVPLVAASALVGVLAVYGLIRPTMNYAITAFVCGDIVAGLVLLDWLRAPRRSPPALAAAIGLALVPLFMARVIAGVAVWLAATAGLLAAPTRDGRRWSAALIVAATFAAGLGLAVSAGAAIGRAIAISALMTASYDTSVYLIDELGKAAIVVGAGAIGAAGIALGGRLFGARARSALAIASVLLVSAAVVIDQRAVIGAAAGHRVNLYGTSYGSYALLVEFGVLAGWGWWRVRTTPAAAAGGRRLAVVSTVALAAWLPFAGTMSGMIPKSGMNTLAINLALLLAVRGCIVGPPGLSPRLLPATAVALAAVTGLFTFLNTLWSPYGVERWTLQTVPLTQPAPLAGLRVIPRQAQLAADLRTLLARRGFDPAHDRVMGGYRMGALLLFADQPIVGHPFIIGGYDGPLTYRYTCEGAAATLTPAVRRVWGLNVDGRMPGFAEPFRADLRACLARLGIDFARGERLRVSPDLTVTILNVRR